METTNTQLLAGKICLVTGASRGIGYETAAGLARLGAHVIIVSQSHERAMDAQQRINAELGKDAARYYVADLSVQAQVNQLAQDITHDYNRLDVLVNNVGGWFRKYNESADGIEMTFALNHLSYFLLTGRLLPLLQQGSPARIINVSSDAHRQPKGIRFDDIHFKQQYRVFSAYAQSKLANVLFTYELARRLEGTDLTVNAIHPGFVKSQLYRHFGLMTPLVNLLADLFGKNAVEGAQTSIYLASSPEVAGITGKYFSDCEPQDSSPASYDISQAKQLWELSEEMTGFTYSI
ncbi:MAG: SDR family oxidoreductase [Brevefilum sp.]|nr:SDR family oxidoreductase [Brevefilum sp.]